ncbi:MAG TPA: nicotinate phosphoribosyltransferase [Candidatus Saccharimonadales bacterium]|nr:nicotinate phosphoribosyltransferase [Candidatus Saccharimonadales bacterium]
MTEKTFATYWDEQTVEHIRKGFYSALYFNRTKQILLQEKKPQTITIQIFQKKTSVLCGIEQVIALLKVGTGYFEKDKWIDTSSEIEIESLSDGDTIAPWETVMHITGPYAYFAHLESLYLGILARQTKIATNTSHVAKAAQNKPVFFFADRFDYFFNQSLDGYAAVVGGAAAVSTPAQGSLITANVVGTIPHALIAVHHGRTVDAAYSFVKEFPSVPLIVLVDFDNDCVGTALAVARKFKKKLFAVRLDTSEMLVDKSLQKTDKKAFGVHPQLVKNVRAALDREGFSWVKIVVSGGFTAEKINSFENESIPVDMYGVGSSLLTGNNDFTADCVKVNGKLLAKEGREYKANKRLHKKILHK